MSVVQQLLRGSAELDRLQSEIKQTIMLLHGLHAGSIKHLDFREYLDTEQFRWEYNHHKDANGVVVRCWEKGKERDPQEFFGINTALPSSMRIRSDHVRPVHSDLNAFADRLIERFNLIYRLEPIFDAAKSIGVT